MEKEPLYVGAKKNPDGSLDLSQAAILISIGKPVQDKNQQESNLMEKRQKIVSDNKQKIQDLFDAFEKGGGQPEVQEARMKVEKLTEQIELCKKSGEDHETIAWFEKELELNQRVVNGERLVDVLDSMQTTEDKKRIAEVRERIKNMKQE